MNSVARMMAWRYLIRKSAADKVISRMALICFIGTMISAFSLALVIAIMNGFEKTAHQKLQGIHAHITIASPTNRGLNYQKILAVIESEFPEITACAPTATKQLLLQNPAISHAHTLLFLTGVDPTREPQVSTLEEKIISGMQSLTHALAHNSLLIGTKLAQKLGLTVGSKVHLLFNHEPEETALTITLTKQNATVGGVFKTGIDYFDEQCAYSSLDFFAQLFNEKKIETINCALKKNNDEKNIINRLSERFTLPVYSWKDLYPTLIATLALEKYAMFFIFSLIALVAGMNIISLLFMYITQKQRDIAILKTLGLSNTYCMLIFCYIGLSITLPATLTGLLFACIASFILEHYPFITLPDSYCVSHLPAYMDTEIIVTIFCCVMIISMVSILYASHKITTITVESALKVNQ